MVFRARCCNPIRGEKIVGYITRGKGVSVHSATCPNVVNLLYDPERRIDVEWDKTAAVDGAARYTVGLKMRVEDRKGLLAAVSAKIADINTNIKNMEVRPDDDGRARIEMTVEISDLKHLEKVLKAVRGVDGVIGRRARGARFLAQRIWTPVRTAQFSCRNSFPLFLSRRIAHLWNRTLPDLRLCL